VYVHESGQVLETFAMRTYEVEQYTQVQNLLLEMHISSGQKQSKEARGAFGP